MKYVHVTSKLSSIGFSPYFVWLNSIASFDPNYRENKKKNCKDKWLLALIIIKKGNS